MWSLQNIKVVFVVVGLVGVLLFAWPSLGLVVHLPYGEHFSELYFLGPGHMASDYPFNVSAGVDYLVYVGVGSHLGGSACYEWNVKFANWTEPLPNSTDATPSPLPRLYGYRVFLADNETRENALMFSFLNITSAENITRVGGLSINGAVYNVDKTCAWDPVFNGTYSRLLVELWLYNASLDKFVYHNRFVDLILNMTAGS